MYTCSKADLNFPKESTTFFCVRTGEHYNYQNKKTRAAWRSTHINNTRTAKERASVFLAKALIQVRWNSNSMQFTLSAVELPGSSLQYWYPATPSFSIWSAILLLSPPGVTQPDWSDPWEGVVWRKFYWTGVVLELQKSATKSHTLTVTDDRSSRSSIIGI